MPKQRKSTIDDAILATIPDLECKLNCSEIYKTNFTSHHHEYVKILKGDPLSIYQKRDENGRNLVKPLSTGNLKRVVKRLRQQIVQGSVTVQTTVHQTADTPNAQLTKYIVDNTILTEGTGETSAFTSKISALVSDSLAFGFGCAYVDYTLDLNNDPQIKLKLINYGDVFPEPDKDTVDEIQWCFVRLWYSKADLESMKGAWDDDAIQAAIDAGTENKFGGGNKRDNDDIDTYSTQVGYPVYVYMERKRGGDVIYYSQRARTVLYSHKNFDPTGEMRVHFLVNDADSSGALGHSLFENLKEIQAAQDEILQLTNWSFALESDPPLVVQGTPDAPVRWRPGAVNYVRQGGGVIPLRTTNQIPEHVTATQQMLTGIITNASGIDDSSIPSLNNSSGLSKTDTGVKNQRAQMDIVTDYYDTVVKSFLSKYIRNAFNVFTSYSAAFGSKKLYISDPVLANELGDAVDDQGYAKIDFKNITMQDLSIVVGGKEFGNEADKVDVMREVLNIINSAQNSNPTVAALVTSIIKMMNLDDSDEIQEAIKQWSDNANKKEEFNQQQQQIQIEQMQTQADAAQKQSDIAPEQMSLQDAQAKAELSLMTKKTQLESLQIDAQILQAQMQITQMQQALANPQAMQQMQQQQGGGS